MDLNLVFTQLIRIEGLDIWEGLSYVGCSREVYADALRLFCVELEKKSAVIAEHLQKGIWNEYTMAVHAVKGALAGIGAWGLAKSALALEKASRNGEYEICWAETAAVLKGMDNLAAALRSTALFAREEEQRRENASIPFLVEKLAQLQHACATGSSDEADALRKELRAKTFDTETDKFLENLYTYIENLDYDLALEVMTNRFPQLKAS